MDKYGVEYNEENTKTSSEVPHCPQCGEALDKSTPNYCNNCGTEPFEKRPPKSDPK